MNSWIPKCNCELFNKKETIKKEDVTGVVTRAWSWIGTHSLIFVTWQRNCAGAGGDWADSGKSLE